MTFTEIELYDALKRVLTTMTFALVVEPRPKDAPSGELLCAAISFGGLQNGKMYLRIPLEIMPELAGNYLATDDTHSPNTQEQLDVLGELINVVGGAVLDRPVGSNRAYELGIPVIGEAYAPGPVYGSRTVAKLWLERGWAELTVDILPGENS